jgi:hypothetical protein
VLRWSVGRARPAQLAADNRIGRWTAYRNLHEGLDPLAVAARRAACLPRRWPPALRSIRT